MTAWHLHRTQYICVVTTGLQTFVQKVFIRAPYKMMRLVISPSHRRCYHLGRKQQQGFRNAITSASTSTSTQSRINWTFSWSLDKQRRKRNNEHKLSSSLPSSSPSSSSSCTATFTASAAGTTVTAKEGGWESIHDPSFHHYHPHNFPFSCSPLLPLNRILPSGRVKTSAATGTSLIQTKTLVSSHHSQKLARSGAGGHGRFLGKMNILNRRLHSSSSLHTSTRSLFSFPTSTVAPSVLSTSTTNARFISTGEDSNFFRVSPEVREALKENVPVVALESAIITHGMPFPDNIDTAFRLESIIRKHGVVPATVGVVDGRVTVGLSQNEVEKLGAWAKERINASSGSRLPLTAPVVKVSRRDFPFVITHKFSGGTTVSGTIIAAVKAGISIFATGGLGGVHRGAELTFDISADLKELGRNPIGVVSAGVKSILDIGKTLEYMETEGICVAVLQKESQSTKGDGQQREQEEKNRGGSGNVSGGNKGEREKEAGAVYAQIGTAKFPSFFTSESPFTAPYSVTSEMEAASLIHSVFQFQLASGVLIAVPIPKEEEAATGKVIEDAIKSALEAAGENSVQGKDMTPFLLGEVNRLTGGLSLKANKHLIENNVRSACGIATHLAQLRRRGEQQRSSFNDNANGDSINNGIGGGNGNSTLSGQRSPQGSEHQLKSSFCNGNRRDPMFVGTTGSASNGTSTLANKVGGNSTETTGEPSSSVSPTQDKTSLRHKRPVVIGGTSLDLVLAVQENEIVHSGGDVGAP